MVISPSKRMSLLDEPYVIVKKSANELIVNIIVVC